MCSLLEPSKHEKCQVEEDDLGELADWLIAINSGKAVFIFTKGL